MVRRHPAGVGHHHRRRPGHRGRRAPGAYLPAATPRRGRRAPACAHGAAVRPVRRGADLRGGDGLGLLAVDRPAGVRQRTYRARHGQRPADRQRGARAAARRGAGRCRTPVERAAAAWPRDGRRQRAGIGGAGAAGSGATHFDRRADRRFRWQDHRLGRAGGRAHRAVLRAAGDLAGARGGRGGPADRVAADRRLRGAAPFHRRQPVPRDRPQCRSRPVVPCRPDHARAPS